jgi:serine/threonine protein kinase
MPEKHESAKTTHQPLDVSQVPEDLRDLPSDLLNHPKYEFLRLIGEGGMGQVFLAKRRNFNQNVAIKLVRIQGNQGENTLKDLCKKSMCCLS